jgi:hypothetical protein
MSLNCLYRKKTRSSLLHLGNVYIKCLKLGTWITYENQDSKQYEIEGVVTVRTAPYTDYSWKIILNQTAINIKKHK